MPRSRRRIDLASRRGGGREGQVPGVGGGPTVQSALDSCESVGELWIRILVLTNLGRILYFEVDDWMMSLDPAYEPEDFVALEDRGYSRPGDPDPFDRGALRRA